MATKLSPAQRANQITWLLKDNLKNLQISYLRVGAGLSQIRDQSGACAREETNPLRALLTSLRAAQKRAKAVPSLPTGVLAQIADLIARVEALADATKQVARIVARPKRSTPAFETV